MVLGRTPTYEQAILDPRFRGPRNSARSMEDGLWMSCGRVYSAALSRL